MTGPYRAPKWVLELEKTVRKTRVDPSANIRNRLKYAASNLFSICPDQPIGDRIHIGATRPVPQAATKFSSVAIREGPRLRQVESN